MNNKGQAVLSEHVMVFFVVIAAIVAMTTFVQRSFEARIHDAKDFMINSVMSNSVCDANCMAATGGKIDEGYEPYYSQMLADTTHKEEENEGETPGNPAAIGAIYSNAVKEKTKTISTSAQLPPECADGPNPKPAYCDTL